MGGAATRGEGTAMPAQPGTGAATPTGGETPKPAETPSSVGATATVPPVDPAPKPAAPAPDSCDARVLQREKPCSMDPDPCGLNSGWEGDEYCLKPPPAGEGIQIHFGPKDYDDPESEYVLESGVENLDSVLANVPLAETRRWGRITAHARPGTHHWSSMEGPPPGAREGVYPGFTICGEDRDRPAVRQGPIGAARTLVYDNLADGRVAPENKGVGTPIAGDSNVCVELHAYNFTDKPRLRELWVNLYFSDEANVAQQAGSISMVGGLGLRVPAGMKQTLTFSAPFTQDGRILQLSGYRQRWTPRFAAWLNDELIYESHDWVLGATFNYDSLTTNPPLDGMHDAAKSGPVSFKAGDTLKFSCFIDNDSDITLDVQSTELEGFESCMLFGTTVGPSLVGTYQ